MNWEACRSGNILIHGTIPAFACRDWGKPRTISDSRTQEFPNTIQEN